MSYTPFHGYIYLLYVQRSEALSQTEAETLIAIFENCDPDNSLGGESMCFYDDPMSFVGKEDWELQGSSKLSPGGPMELLADLRQKCAALSECRASVAAATWNVNMDDQDIDWDHDGNVTIDGQVVDWDGDLQGVEETVTSMDQSPEPRRKGWLRRHLGR